MRILINGCFTILHDGHKELFRQAFMFNRLRNPFNKYLYDHSKILLCPQERLTIDLMVLINDDKYLLENKNKLIFTEYSKRKANLKEMIREVSKEFAIPGIGWDQFTLSIMRFSTEEQLDSMIDDFEPDLMIKGSDYSDLSKVIGFPKWPILIIPIVKNNNGEKLSSSRIEKIDSFDEKVEKVQEALKKIGSKDLEPVPTIKEGPRSYVPTREEHERHRRDNNGYKSF
jgi:phosphopantetheine adenylyltransferase